MNKSPWTIDSKLRKGTHTNGTVATFSYDSAAKVWTCATPLEFLAPTKDDAKKLAAEALAAWHEALDEGIATMTAAGEAMYGANWMLATARDLDVNYASMQRWMNKERALTMDHPIWEVSVPAALEAHAKAQLDIVAKIKERLLTATTITSGRYAHAAEQVEQK
jgi:hypothetical protein